HYNFKYEGFSYEGKNIVNKIKVTPKRKSKLLFEGTLYIMEDYWCLKQADLTFDTPIGPVNLYMTYDEVSPSIWLPVSHNFTFDANMMGIRGSGKFTTSMKYTDLDFNQSVLDLLNLPVRPETTTQLAKQTPAPGAVSKKSSKNLEKKKEKIDVLLEKKELSNRDMNKLSRLMESTGNHTSTDSLKTLEMTESVKVVIDPMAARYDSAFWNSMRPIPLASEELQSFKKRDSMTVAEKKNPKAISITKKNFNMGVFTPFFAGSHSTFKDSTWHFNYYGLFNIRRFTFNAVDGFVLNQEILFTKNYKPGRSLEIRPRVAYAFNRETFMANLGINYNYAPMHRGKFELKTGSYSEDFNKQRQSVSPFINTISSLFFKTNYARFYSDQYLKMANSIDLANGLVLQANAEWKNATELENSTNYSFVRQDEEYQPNNPENREVTAEQLASQKTAKAGFRLEYTPRYYYRIRNGIKKMSHSDFPTFRIGYEKGFKNIFSSTSDYDYLHAGINHAIEFSQTSSLAWEIDGGWYANSSQLHFSEFAHAMTQTSPVLQREFRHAFYARNYYELSTSDRYVNGFVSFKSPLILLKYLPVLSNTLWREMIWAGYYGSPANPHHTEIGYTLLEVFYTFNVGVFAGFDKLEFTRFGVNMSFRISYPEKYE
ncbi:MAG TPA: DUF5686 family protein, partial [Prolixibacteraceae bacterium]|nr:DUF5686 family protein [Prolixibacteraceae bacterium]